MKAYAGSASKSHVQESDGPQHRPFHMRRALLVVLLLCACQVTAHADNAPRPWRTVVRDETVYQIHRITDEEIGTVCYVALPNYAGASPAISCLDHPRKP